MTTTLKPKMTKQLNARTWVKSIPVSDKTKSEKSTLYSSNETLPKHTCLGLKEKNIYNQTGKLTLRY